MKTLRDLQRLEAEGNSLFKKRKVFWYGWTSDSQLGGILHSGCFGLYLGTCMIVMTKVLMANVEQKPQARQFSRTHQTALSQQRIIQPKMPSCGGWETSDWAAAGPGEELVTLTEGSVSGPAVQRFFQNSHHSKRAVNEAQGLGATAHRELDAKSHRFVSSCNRLEKA